MKSEDQSKQLVSFTQWGMDWWCVSCPCCFSLERESRWYRWNQGGVHFVLKRPIDVD